MSLIFISEYNQTYHTYFLLLLSCTPVFFFLINSIPCFLLITELTTLLLNFPLHVFPRSSHWPFNQIGNWSTNFVELGWGVDDGSTWCLDEVGVGLGLRCCCWLRVMTAFLRVCSTDSWFHSSSGLCLVYVCHLVAPWL